MAVQHMLTDIDTLQTLAYKYFGDATRWQEIADYNNLEYPYIVQDASELLSLYGRGYVQITRGNYMQAITIKKGWQFRTKPNLYINGLRKYFEVSEDTIIPAGIATWSIPCKCTVPGTFGNVTAGSICEAGDNTLAESNISFISITNPSSFTGGQDLSILTTGDNIYIPIETSEASYSDASRIADIVEGSDLLLDIDGDLAFDEAAGDLEHVSGHTNVEYAVAGRIGTELGDLIIHSEYGTEFEELIGTPNIANKEKLATLSILRSLSYEDRITDIQISELTIDDQNRAASAAVTYKLVSTGEAVTTRVTR